MIHHRGGRNTFYISDHVQNPSADAFLLYQQLSCSIPPAPGMLNLAPPRAATQHLKALRLQRGLRRALGTPRKTEKPKPRSGGRQTATNTAGRVVPSFPRARRVVSWCHFAQLQQFVNSNYLSRLAALYGSSLLTRKRGNRTVVLSCFKLLFPGTVCWKAKQRAPGARLLCRGGEGGISAAQTARGGSAELPGNRLMLVEKKNNKNLMNSFWSNSSFGYVTLGGCGVAWGGSSCPAVPTLSPPAVATGSEGVRLALRLHFPGFGPNPAAVGLQGRQMALCSDA